MGETGGGRPFKFINFMADHASFNGIISSKWEKYQGRVDITSVWRRINAIKKELKKLHREEFRNVKGKLNDGQYVLQVNQEILVGDPNNTVAQENELIIVEEVKYWHGIEEYIMKQKVRVDWFREGDINSHCFRMLVKAQTS